MRVSDSSMTVNQWKQVISRQDHVVITHFPKNKIHHTISPYKVQLLLSAHTILVTHRLHKVNTSKYKIQHALTFSHVICITCIPVGISNTDEVQYITNWASRLFVKLITLVMYKVRISATIGYPVHGS